MPDPEVFLTSDAEEDLEDLVNYIETHDSSERADHVYARIKKSILTLRSSPNRGRVVPELKQVGLSEYREIFYKPFRILYFTLPRKVIVFAVFDGRRDLDDVLQQRLLKRRSN